MNRREFLKVVGVGSLTLYLSGCGLSAMNNTSGGGKEVAAQESISGGKSMKIVVIRGRRA